ncbi:hypothetical protein PFISCL1PPCAC_22533, partial [Pristionchus fissidentatus]
ESALVTIEEWSERACTSGSKDGVVVTAALQLMKCLVTRDLEALALATITLDSKHSDVFDDDEMEWNCVQTTESVPRFLLFGVLKALQATARAMAASGGIDFGGLNGVNTMADRAIKDEIDDEETMENYDSASHIIAPLEDDVKLEEDINEEKPLCPPLVDTIKIRTSSHAAQRVTECSSGPAAPLPSIRFRKATKRDYADTMSAPPSASNAAKATPQQELRSQQHGGASSAAPSTSSAAATPRPVATVHPGAHASAMNGRAQFRQTSMYKCKECSRVFRDYGKYQSHDHNVPTFPCGECGWTFSSEKDLARHTPTHARPGTHVCS